ncbi:MAG: hypothetical protein HKN29_08365 [Rhodothermales bacterium]|nr:hypothetical protein [Rhodothermales bacterium]
MPLELYKFLHLVGLILLFAAMGGSVITAGTANTAWRKMHGMMHGIGAFLLLLGGFGMLAKLQIIASWPGWVWGKLVIWVLLGAAPFLLKKVPEKARALLFGMVLLGVVAAYLALYKPF